MRLGISKSKNTINYYIIKDYTKNGKRSTKHVLRIGNLEEVKIMAGNMDYNEWLKEFVKKYNDKIKIAEEQELKALQLENDIEKFLFEILGLKINKNIQKKKKLFSFKKFSNLISS